MEAALLEASSPIHMFARRAAVCLLVFACAAPAALTLLAAPAHADESGGGDGGDGGGDGGGAGDSGGGAGDGSDSGSGGDAGGGGHSDSGGSSGGGDEFRNDHVTAWRARNSGAIRPLRGIIAHIRRTYGGSILDVKLKRRGGRAWYVIRILDSHDRVRTLRAKAGRARRGKNGH
jgi:hypothetical protein